MRPLARVATRHILEGMTTYEQEVAVGVELDGRKLRCHNGRSKQILLIAVHQGRHSVYLEVYCDSRSRIRGAGYEELAVNVYVASTKRWWGGSSSLFTHPSRRRFYHLLGRKPVEGACPTNVSGLAPAPTRCATI